MAFKKIVSATLDNDHKNRAVAGKLVIGGFLPIGPSEKKVDKAEFKMSRLMRAESDRRRDRWIMLKRYPEQRHVDLDSGCGCLALQLQRWQECEFKAYGNGWNNCRDFFDMRVLPVKPSECSLASHARKKVTAFLKVTACLFDEFDIWSSKIARRDLFLLICYWGNNVSSTLKSTKTLSFRALVVQLLKSKVERNRNRHWKITDRIVASLIIQSAG